MEYRCILGSFSLANIQNSECMHISRSKRVLSTLFTNTLF
uniref:Uncharacterized protein n=1 Tax=Anguilla anguilla TaxID=7936 RepID=A0A0E9WB48_ANGAN